ncbi:PREDICTED: uncharacterized protein LOC109160499 [Ipomoea nil]|uniref:uncharacterized protein LOC109160499 n=1 Tax=Ipomoea nil TaxID=35883 RepID=UPI000900FCE7|nr:PREDICTED: uncharacterized protein LOC109160499 [Ipomoea nil]
MVSRKKPKFVFLMETKVGRVHAERLRVKLGFDGLFYVDSTGLSGGLALPWKTNNTARLLSFSKNHVDIEVSIPGFIKWRMTGFYGFPQRGRRDDCGLSQMPMQEYPYTWEKGNETPDWMEERLDKVLATKVWRGVVVGASVQNILTRNSYHSALYLGIMDPRGRGNGRKRGFRFEMAWLHVEGCRSVVEKSLDEGRGGGLQNCIGLCGDRLMRWGGDRFHKFGEQIMNLRKEQLLLRERTDPASLAEFQRLEEHLSRLETQEDVYWRQRAKQHWLREADANT